MLIFKFRFLPLILIFSISFLWSCRGLDDDSTSIPHNNESLPYVNEQLDEILVTESVAPNENKGEEIFVPYVESDPVDQTEAQEFNCYGPEQHRIGLGISEKFEVTYEEVMIWFCGGSQFEDILLALQTSELASISVNDLLVKRANGQMWDDIWKDIGLVGQTEP
jgi:hypothetical protein